MAKSKNLNSNIIKKMYEEGKSLREIASFFDVHHRAIQYHLERMNVQMREINKWGENALQRRSKPIPKEVIEEILWQKSEGENFVDILKEKNIKPSSFRKYKNMYFGNPDE